MQFRTQLDQLLQLAVSLVALQRVLPVPELEHAVEFSIEELLHAVVGLRTVLGLPTIFLLVLIYLLLRPVLELDQHPRAHTVTGVGRARRTHLVVRSLVDHRADILATPSCRHARGAHRGGPKVRSPLVEDRGYRHAQRLLRAVDVILRVVSIDFHHPLDMGQCGGHLQLDLPQNLGRIVSPNGELFDGWWQRLGCGLGLIHFHSRHAASAVPSYCVLHILHD